MYCVMEMIRRGFRLASALRDHDAEIMNEHGGLQSLTKNDYTKDKIHVTYNFQSSGLYWHSDF